MKLEDFVIDFDMASLSLEDFAYSAETVEDCVKLKNAAKLFLRYRDDFIYILNEVGVEIG